MINIMYELMAFNRLLNQWIQQEQDKDVPRTWQQRQDIKQWILENKEALTCMERFL